MNIKHTGRVSSSQVTFDNQELLRKHLTSLEGLAVEVMIRPIKPFNNVRSNNQNAYYFGVIVSMCRDAISEAYGESMSAEMAHDTLKEYCNFREIVKGDKILRVTESTADLTTDQFEAYTQRCREWMFNWFNVVVPLPNEVWSE
jgi:hypothetical protein